jgi:hypothetical protein
LAEIKQSQQKRAIARGLKVDVQLDEKLVEKKP